jgi:hypothetical protein
MKRRIERAAWLLAVGWMVLTCAAQKTVSVPREDGRETPLMVYDVVMGDGVGERGAVHWR